MREAFLSGRPILKETFNIEMQIILLTLETCKAL